MTRNLFYIGIRVEHGDWLEMDCWAEGDCSKETVSLSHLSVID